MAFITETITSPQMVYYYIFRMLKGSETQKSSLVLSVIGLVLLFLLSPCKVRNYIQFELGVPQTNVTNKSQSTFTQSYCGEFKQDEVIQIDAKHGFPKPDFTYSPSECLNPGAYSPPCFITYLSSNLRGKPVPLYVLYQKFKIYL